MENQNQYVPGMLDELARFGEYGRKIAEIVKYPTTEEIRSLKMLENMSKHTNKEEYFKKSHLFMRQSRIKDLVKSVTPEKMREFAQAVTILSTIPWQNVYQPTLDFEVDDITSQ